jgi:hypothetical protein
MRRLAIYVVAFRRAMLFDFLVAQPVKLARRDLPPGATGYCRQAQFEGLYFRRARRRSRRRLRSIPLKEWVDRLADIDSSKKKIPFVAEDLGLDGRLRQNLQEIGVIYEDIEKSAADRLYVPEIYRHGLSLGSGAGARPRVQALLQRALGSLPF